MQWLPRRVVPPALAALLLHAKPTSAVVLTEHVIFRPDIPTMLLISSEGVRVMVSSDEICYQVVLDFERSTESPEVVKAIRRLRRARRKLHALFLDLKAEGEHLALVPVAWSQSTKGAEARWFAGVTKAGYCSHNLAFCGDSYGTSGHDDENLIRSLLTACASLDFAGDA